MDNDHVYTYIAGGVIIAIISLSTSAAIPALLTVAGLACMGWLTTDR
mgnify:CR=1 FL=1